MGGGATAGGRAAAMEAGFALDTGGALELGNCTGPYGGGDAAILSVAGENLSAHFGAAAAAALALTAVHFGAAT